MSSRVFGIVGSGRIHHVPQNHFRDFRCIDFVDTSVHVVDGHFAFDDDAQKVRLSFESDSQASILRVGRRIMWVSKLRRKEPHLNIITGYAIKDAG